MRDTATGELVAVKKLERGSTVTVRPDCMRDLNCCPSAAPLARSACCTPRMVDHYCSAPSSQTDVAHLVTSLLHSADQRVCGAGDPEPPHTAAPAHCAVSRGLRSLLSVVCNVRCCGAVLADATTTGTAGVPVMFWTAHRWSCTGVSDSHTPSNCNGVCAWR